MEQTATQTDLTPANNTTAQQIVGLQEQLEKFKRSEDPAAKRLAIALEEQLEAFKQQPPLDVDTDLNAEQKEASPDQDNEVAMTADTPLEGQAPGAATMVIDQARKQAIEALFSSSINNPRFWANPKRLDRLEDALKVPLFDNKSLQGFATGAREELIKKAMDTAIKNKTVPVMPTEAEIATLAEEKYQDKVKKDAEKSAKAVKKK